MGLPWVYTAVPWVTHGHRLVAHESPMRLQNKEKLYISLHGSTTEVPRKSPFK
ncbi:unnamed protein product, partial [Laminaria digitata]